MDEYSREEWDALVREYNDSGMSLSEWCLAKGIDEERFGYHGDSEAHSGAPSGQFVNPAPSVPYSKPKRNADEWKALIADLKASGKTQAQWCREKGVNESSLYSAMCRLSGKRRTIANKAKKQTVGDVKFVEVAKPASSGSVHGSVRITSGSMALSADADYPAEKLLLIVKGMMAS
jgi:lambda repressor-like predicted transcriptional regulator